MKRLTDRLSYANVTASLALFIALGGTSYAVTQLPRNSVGSAQLRTGAVSSKDVRDRGVGLRDISPATRRALQGAKGDTGPAGPAGLTLRAVINSGGAVVRGNATTTDHQGGTGKYAVAFDRDVSGCVATASLSDAQNGATLETPPAGRVTVGIEGTRVAIRTFAADGAAQDLPFSVIVAC